MRAKGLSLIPVVMILAALFSGPVLAQDGGLDSSDRLAGTWYVLGIEIFNGNRSQTYNGVLTFNSQGGLSSGTLTYPAARNPELGVESARFNVASDGSLSGTLTREDEQTLTVTFGRLSDSGDKIILAGERTDSGGTIWDVNEIWIK